jgi:uncharacterized protein YjbJ (UPF0337 family)
MGGKMDDVKGRIKEAAGDLKGDPELRQEGQQDRAAGAVKDKVEQGADKLNDKIDDLRDAVRKD